MSAELVIVGTSPRRVDGLDKVTGAAQYAADFARPGMLYGKIKRSPHAHARVVKVDPSRAYALPGVKVVLTVDNVPRVRHAGAPPPRNLNLAQDQYILDHVVRFVGDGVAAVAAISEEIADEALDLIDVEYELLPAVFDAEPAMLPGAPSLHGTEQNLVSAPMVIERGDLAQGLADADAVIDGVYSTGRPVPCYMEPNACVCEFDGSGKLTVWSSTQTPFMVRGILSEVLSIPLNQIRVVVEHMGGGFGAKQDLYQFEFLCALLAKKSGRPVKMEYTRRETFVAGRTRHPVTVDLKQGYKRDGALTARAARYVSNTGAYSSHGMGITRVGCIDLASLYRCPNLKVEGRSVYTNNPIAGAFRGYGAVQAFFALDVQMDEIAQALGMDPVALRLKNAIGTGDAGPSGHILPGDSLAACLRRGAEEIGWYSRQKRVDPSGRVLHGWGVGTEMHPSGAYPAVKEQSNALVKMNEDGSVHLMAGISDLGTGARTVMAQIAAEALGLPFESIRVITGDTDVVPFDIGAYASHTTFVGGGAVLKAALDLKAQLLQLAGDKLEAAAEDLDIRNGRISVRGSPDRHITVQDVVKGGAGGIAPRALIGKATHEPKNNYSFAAHFVEVEVDAETGQVTILQVVAVHEVGKAINPIGVEGQIEGGLQQGIGHSLTEDFIVDRKTGRPLNAGFVDYKMPLSLDMPKIKTVILEEVPDPAGPFGAKGVGEDPIIAIGPAIANAVSDAIGVRMRELPITPDKVLHALTQKAAAPA
jgi:xanthine dehydrogenase molybdenum-binding subunit